MFDMTRQPPAAAVDARPAGVAAATAVITAPVPGSVA